MTHSISVFSELGTDAEKKRALTKVYALLVKLAEEKRNNKEFPATSKTGKKTSVPLKINTPPAV